MPAASRFGAAEMRHGRFFFLGGHVRTLARIEADENDLVVAAGIEGEHTQGADDALLGLVAEHGATVVHEREEYWLLREILAEHDIAASLIAERKIERQMRVERRFESNVLQHGRYVLCRGTCTVRHSLSACSAGAK